MQWEEVPEELDGWVVRAAAPAWDVRQRAANVLTDSHVGYYYHPDLEKVAVFAPLATSADLARCKAAAERAVGSGHVRRMDLAHEELEDPHGCWVKVAYSPALRRAGELLNFFPGQYAGGVPNSPSPLAAMLTSGLVGAGLGWGLGTLGNKLLPDGYGGHLGRTGAALGGLLGAAPGAFWGLSNKSIGRRFNDPILLNDGPDAEPIDYPRWIDGLNAGRNLLKSPGPGEVAPAFHMVEQMHDPYGAAKQAADDLLGGVELGRRYREAAKEAASTFGTNYGLPPNTPVDVNIDALGRTLYDTGAGPELAGSAMGAMYAARQMPDRSARPGWVTGNQLGQLTMNAAGDYATGLLAGAAINAAIGTPFRYTTFGGANAALGVLGAVVPKLFGG